jgi:type IV secretory pathway VirD2 relaxase
MSARRSKIGRGSSGGRLRKHPSRQFQQRCAIRVTYSPNKSAGQWKAHGYYLARERATEKAEKNTAGFNRTENAVDISPRLDHWQQAGDERLFKIIISPEFGDRIDLEAHTKQLMARIDRDLRTELEWVAVIHHNTDHPHVHVALRGVDRQGKAVHLPREYVKTGIRSHAEDLVTKELGHRTEHDAIEAQRREVDQLRFNSLDRTIQRQNPNRADFFTVRCDPTGTRERSFLAMQEQHIAARLSKLESMGLAENLGGCAWRVRGDFGAVLRMMQRTTDRQRVLASHGALLSDERLPLEVTGFKKLNRVEGRVVAHGQEEGTDRAYIMIEGVDGKVHLLYQNEEIQNARRQGLLRVNSFARIEKRFPEGMPNLHVEDFGDAFDLLKNNSYFDNTALKLIQCGVTEVERTWSGWLGDYQDAIEKHLGQARTKARVSRGYELGR